jgi:hypothetical protein
VAGIGAAGGTSLRRLSALRLMWTAHAQRGQRTLVKLRRAAMR